MKNIVRIMLVVILSFAASFTMLSCAKKPASQAGQARQEEAKKITVATVNGVPITMESLVKMMNRMSVKKPGEEPLTAEALKKKALDRLILQELAYQKAKADGIKPEEKYVDTAIANVKENVGGEKEYKEFIEKQNLTENDLRAQVRRSLTLELIYAREVNGKITIPEETLREDYEKVKDKYLAPEKITVTDVVFLARDNDNASTKKNMKKAKNVLKKIHANQDKDPWRLVLDGSFIVRNIDIVKDKDKELYSAAKKLKVGELSGVVKTPDSLHIIKLKAYQPERQLSFDEVKGTLEGKFRVQAQEKRLEEWERELNRDAKIDRKDVKIEIADTPAAEAKEKKN